jgi:hypothetical protein
MDREAGSKAASFVLSRSQFYWQRYIKPFFAFHQSARCAANRVASGVVIPSAVAVAGAILVVGPHGVPRVTIVSAGCIWGAAIVRRPGSQRSAPIVLCLCRRSFLPIPSWVTRPQPWQPCRPLQRLRQLHLRRKQPAAYVDAQHPQHSPESAGDPPAPGRSRPIARRRLARTSRRRAAPRT